MGSVAPTPERIAQLAALEGDGPIVMINLLRYRAEADYPVGFDAAPCSGREADQRDGAVAGPLILASGGRPIWIGRVQASAIAPEGEEWDDAILVEYPSRVLEFDVHRSRDVPGKSDDPIEKGADDGVFR